MPDLLVRRASAHLLLALLLSVPAGCLGVLSGPVDVEAIVRDGTEGSYTLDVVTLHTPTDLVAGEGRNVRYLRDFSFSADIRDEIADVSTYPAVDDIVSTARERSGGRLPEPLLSRQGDVIVADDFDSLMMLSSWLAIERTFDLFEELGDPGGVGSDPLVAALYGRVHGALGFPSGGADNAAYLALADAMFIEPTFWLGKVQGGLPLSANEGVIAHELGHRLFFYAFYRLGAETTWRRDLSEGFDNDDERILSGFNEGIADLVGVAVTGDPGFGNPSALGEDRDLDNDAIEDFTLEPMLDGTHPCNEGSPIGSEGFSIYCVGTVFALTMWETSNRDAERLRTLVLPAISRSLTTVAEQTELATDGAEQLVFDYRWLLEALAADLDGEARTAFCAAAERRFVRSDAAASFTCP